MLFRTSFPLVLLQKDSTALWEEFRNVSLVQSMT